MEHPFLGTHILSEIYGVSEDKFKNITKVVACVERGIEKSGATLVKTHYFKFEPIGFTIVSILKESHVSIHTYPEQKAAFIDVFTCGNIVPEIIVQEIIAYFSPKRTQTQTINRGIRDTVS